MTGKKTGFFFYFIFSCCPCTGHLIHHLFPEFPEMELVQLSGEEPSAPGTTVHPVDDLIDDEQDLLPGPDRYQFPANLRVSPIPAPYHNEGVAVVGLDEVEMACTIQNKFKLSCKK
jgi:hypothetical protein